MKLEQIKTRDAKLRNNTLFKVYKRMFYKMVKEEKKKKITKILKVWVGIWQDNTYTTQKKLKNTLADTLTGKVDNVQLLAINKKKELVNPCIDRTQNFWKKNSDKHKGH